jgi:hypothetical protein
LKRRIHLPEARVFGSQFSTKKTIGENTAAQDAEKGDSKDAEDAPEQELDIPQATSTVEIRSVLPQRDDSQSDRIHALDLAPSPFFVESELTATRREIGEVASSMRNMYDVTSTLRSEVRDLSNSMRAEMDDLSRRFEVLETTIKQQERPKSKSGIFLMGRRGSKGNRENKGNDERKKGDDEGCVRSSQF